MIEVLIAAIVLSIGLLGIAGLQAQSLRKNQSALMRSQASILAYDMADRMRANMPAVNAGAYHLPVAATNADCTTTTGCTPAQLAQHGAAEWNAEISQSLPGGEGVVCLDSDPLSAAGTSAANSDCDNAGSIYAIKIWWDDDRDSATPNQRFVTSFQP
jgi:type IV pilus assembly protein PilV